MPMKTIVCHAGAMSGRPDGPKVAAAASFVIASGTALSGIKRHHRPEWLMMRQFPEEGWGNLAQVRPGVLETPRSQNSTGNGLASGGWRKLEKIWVLHLDI
jgi:hypothetical protein